MGKYCMRFTALILASLIFAAEARAEGSYSISEFIHNFEQHQLDSFIETEDGTIVEHKKHSTAQFLQTELPYLADDNKILPILKPNEQMKDSFSVLRGRMIRLLENTPDHEGVEWKLKESPVQMNWQNNGNWGPSGSQVITYEPPVEYPLERTIRAKSTISFSGHVRPPLSKFGRFWDIRHEINTHIWGKPISHLEIERLPGRPENLSMRFKSFTMGKTLISVLSKDFKIFSSLSDRAGFRAIQFLNFMATNAGKRLP